MKNQERWIDRFLNKKFEYEGYEFSMLNILFMLCIAVLAMIMRAKLFPIESADYYGFLKPWMDVIREKGGISSLSEEISNYPVSYMYIMTLLSYVSNNDLFALKQVSIVFDYLSAYAMFLIILEITKSVNKSIFGATMVLLAPMVLLDGAYWCQCDIIYSTFILFAMYNFYKGRSRWTGIFLGLAFCFKLQTVLILPFFIMMWLKNKNFNIIHLIWMPIVYVISIIPAWITGRSFKDLLLFYFGQASYYPWGTLNYPNAYYFLDESIEGDHHADEVSGAGMIFAIILLGCLTYYLYLKKVEMTNEIISTIALLSVGVAVYFMPHMHDRYGFLLDLLAIIYVILRPKKLPVFVGLSLVSTLCSVPYLVAVEVVPFTYQALILGGILLYVGMDLYKQISKAPSLEGSASVNS